MEVKSESEVAQSCQTRRDSMDCSLPDSSVHGIFQARALEWGAITFSKYMNTNAITVDDVNVQIHLNKNSDKIFSLQNAEEGEKRKVKEICFRVSKELI